MAVSETAARDLEMSLERISKSICTFSSVFMSLYMEYDGSSQEEWWLNYRKLRDDTAMDAIVYFKKVLPSCNAFVENIAVFFNDYKNYKFESWLKRVDQLMTKVRLYKANGISLQESGDIVNQLQCKGQKLNLIESKLQKHNLPFNEHAKQGDYSKYLPSFSKKGNKKIPEDCGVAPINLEGESNEMRAIKVVKTYIIPSVLAFIEAIRRLSIFFSKIEIDLQPFLEIPSDIRVDAVAGTDTGKSYEWPAREGNIETPYLNPSASENVVNVPEVESGNKFQSESSVGPGMATPVSNEAKVEQSLPKDVRQTALEHHRMISEMAFSILKCCDSYHSAIPNLESDLAAIGKFIGSSV